MNALILGKAGDSRVLLFSHPADFTAVYTTEIGRPAQLSAEFAKRNIKPCGLSTNTAEHRRWIEDLDDAQNTDVKFPILADADLTIARIYDMFHPEQSETAAARSEFIIEPAKPIRLTMTYRVGRNFNDSLRLINALHTGDARRIATPADWQPGRDVMIPPSVNDDEAATLYPQRWTALRPNLRTLKVA